MQPIKISIQGDYMDCQIYSSRLYIWTFEGELKVYKWADLISSLTNAPIDELLLTFCFINGQYLYKNDLTRLFNDEDFKKILLDKFLAASKRKYELTEKQVDNFLFGRQDTPSSLLPTDTEIYGSNLYYITEKGLFSSSVNWKNKKYPVDKKTHKHWDCNLLSIKANKYPQLALSGGREGLFEFDLSSEGIQNKKEPVQISKKHSSFANYTFWSIYNSSIVDNSYMALFDLSKIDDGTKPKKYKRVFKEEINERDVFKSTENGRYLSWGDTDKIYGATDYGLEVVSFKNNPRKDMGEDYFTQIESINLELSKGKVIEGGTSHFGTIVEYEDALVVLLSDGQMEIIEGPITRWRIYPRSSNYQNHLHVIKDDKIEIYSFNQDYFLRQDEKVLGIKYGV